MAGRCHGFPSTPSHTWWEGSWVPQKLCQIYLKHLALSGIWMILVGMLLPGRNDRDTLIILLATLITMFEATSHSAITKTHNDTTNTTQEFNELGLFQSFQCCFTCLSWVSRSIVKSTHGFERLPGMCFDRLEVKRWPAVHEWPQTTTVP